ncbi:spore coat protein CotJB [Ruminococcus sp. 5_1_39BFAA]|uniref:spore coat protein CotJB n=1 Tax=Ruminococcus sp. 5_1_39BFAA TaxID=457412 RepID=UPI003566CFE5
MMRQNENSSRSRLLQSINEVSFAVNDILLYLDTHPCDEKALAYYKDVAEQRRKLMDEYARTCGPLTVDDALLTGGDTWKWMEQPFPWEKEGA